MRKKTIEKEDIFIGQRLKHRRSSFGISQSRLAQLEKLTFQQVQKYESGKNRISASRLYRFARILHVPISYFFDGMDETTDSSIEISDDDKSAQIGIQKLNKYFLSIRNSKLQNAVVSLARHISEADADNDNKNKR